MKLLTKSDFDLCYDIKNLPDLERKIREYENPIHLLDLMYKEIILLNKKLATAERKLKAATQRALGKLK